MDNANDRVFEEEYLLQHDPNRARKNYQGVGRVSAQTGTNKAAAASNEVSGVEAIDPFIDYKKISTPYWLRDDNDEHVEKHRRLLNEQQRLFRETGQEVGRDNVLCDEQPKGGAPFYLLDPIEKN